MNAFAETGALGAQANQRPVGVFGAGAWGTALAQCIALAGNDVLLWDRDPLVVADINKLHENRKRYPGMLLSERISAVSEPGQLTRTCAVMVVAVPSDVNTVLAAQLTGLLQPGQTIVLGSKGFRESDGALLSRVWQEAFPFLVAPVADDAPGGLVAITGPAFARELMEQKLTALLVASERAPARAQVADLFNVPFVRCYESPDIIGAQVGGAIKNILAVAAGILDGLDMGHNARAALLTRGLVEMGRYSRAVGGADTTVWGLAGMGDLLLTATSTLSRNYRFGQLVGRGVAAPEARMRIGTVEGVLAARIVTVQAQAHGLDLAIVSAIDGILHGDVTPLKAVDYLMQRPRVLEFGV